MVKYSINITAQIEIEETPPPEPPFEMPDQLKGFSGTPEDDAGMDLIIENLLEYEGNCYRICFTPSWTAGTRPWDATQVDYLLTNWALDNDGFIIVDRNHHLADTVPLTNPPADNSWDVTGVRAGLQDVLDEWGITSATSTADEERYRHVLVELINEFVWDAGGNVYDHCEPEVDDIRANGYTNLLVLNQHTSDNEWTTIGCDYYGKHFYMNNYTEAQFQGHMTNALNADCIPIVNTEMGAEADEPPFTEAHVTELEADQAWLSARNYGYCIWMNKDMDNLTLGNGYDDRGWAGLI